MAWHCIAAQTGIELHLQFAYEQLIKVGAMAPGEYIASHSEKGKERKERTRAHVDVLQEREYIYSAVIL